MGQPVTITPDQAPSQTGPVTITPDSQPQSGMLSQAWDAVKSRAGSMAQHISENPTANAVYDVSAPGIAEQYYKKFTGQPNTVGQLPQKLATTALPMMVGEPEAAIGEEAAAAKPAASAARPAAAAGEAAEGSGSGALSRAMDVAKRRANHIPGVQAVKDLNYIVRGAGDAPEPPAPKPPAVPDNWGKGQFGTPIDQWGQKLPYTDPGAPLPEHPGTFPGAPNPETPDPQLLKARALFEGSSSPQDPAAGLGTVKQSNVAPGQAGQLAESMQKPAPSADVSNGFKRGSLGDLLDQSLGAKKLEPNVPLRQQVSPRSGAISSSVDAPPTDLPEGHTPVQSSWIKSYKYDPSTREFEMQPKSGTAVRLGDVSAEDAQAFTDAKSQGSAWQQIKNNVLVAKRINGKWVAVKPAQ